VFIYQRKFASSKTFNPDKKHHPWFTAHHGSLIAEKDRLYNLYKRSKLEFELQEYRNARDFAHEQITVARFGYYWS